jgi:hypothetical protein
LTCRNRCCLHYGNFNNHELVVCMQLLFKTSTPTPLTPTSQINSKRLPRSYLALPIPNEPGQTDKLWPTNWTIQREMSSVFIKLPEKLMMCTVPGSRRWRN